MNTFFKDKILGVFLLDIGSMYLSFSQIFSGFSTINIVNFLGDITTILQFIIAIVSLVIIVAEKSYKLIKLIAKIRVFYLKTKSKITAMKWRKK
jgi:hypothetical protein